MKKISNEQGQCPCCNSLNLDYGASDFDGNWIEYPWVCKDCGAMGHELYVLKFVEHYNVYDKDEHFMED